MALAVIKNNQQKVNEETVELARKLLCEAKAGEIESIFAVVFAPSGAYGTRFSASIDSLSKIGALECLKADYAESVKRE